jgi:hypothetical protein
MIYDSEQTKVFLGDKEYRGQLLEKQLGTKIFGESLSPLGNILCFESPVSINQVNLPNALVFTAQLPFTNSFGGVCFQRLYTAQVGAVLSQLLDRNVEVNGYTLFVDGKPVTITSQNIVKETFLFTIILPVEQNDTIFHVAMEESMKESVKQQLVGCFYRLTGSIFQQIQNDDI